MELNFKNYRRKKWNNDIIKEKLGAPVIQVVFCTVNKAVLYEKGKFDELIEEKGVKILIDPKALMHVIGTKMDFVDDKLRSEFIFINPNSKGQCGCGESFMTTASKGAEK
ncbi:iron-sulfur assembly protein IscA-like 1, mitochondrial isoform X2 [Solanum lycopersicum]|uniref:iron-sulfur assembly protein IscA-like 1, mitochondrial isoform X2 n=1 Tax=Solanum lycopersicum TaxID=4081 RepID=UPI003748063B